MIFRVIAAAVLSMLCASLQGDGFNYSSYKEAEIDDLAKTLLDLSQGDGDITQFIALMDKRKISVEYSGVLEPITAERKLFVEQYFKAVGVAPTAAALFEQELLVKVDEKTYRLPVQTPLIQHMKAGLQVGAQVSLYAIFAGSVPPSGLVLLINEFDQPQ